MHYLSSNFDQHESADLFDLIKKVMVYKVVLSDNMEKPSNTSKVE